MATGQKSHAKTPRRKEEYESFLCALASWREADLLIRIANPQAQI
jgi:hypothetical protein